MFDIITLGEQAFKFGLRSVLQDSELLKVVHDCRQVNNCLNQQWSVTLSNIWNTMAGDIVFSNDGFVPQYARSLAHLLKDYLGIADTKIYFPRYRRSHLAYDSSIWQSRPPPTHLVLGAARNTLYLLALYKKVRAGTLLPSRINYPDDCIKEEEVNVTMSGEEKLQAREELDDRNPMNSTVPVRKMKPKVTSFLFLVMSYQRGNI